MNRTKPNNHTVNRGNPMKNLLEFIYEFVMFIFIMLMLLAGVLIANEFFNN